MISYTQGFEIGDIVCLIADIESQKLDGVKLIIEEVVAESSALGELYMCIDLNGDRYLLYQCEISKVI